MNTEAYQRMAKRLQEDVLAGYVPTIPESFLPLIVQKLADAEAKCDRLESVISAANAMK